MHYLYFVKIDKKLANDWDFARHRAYNNLIDEWFIGNWFFSNGKCDRFVVWGRWSWILGWKKAKDNYKCYWWEGDAQIIDHKLIEKLKRKGYYKEDIECYDINLWTENSITTLWTEDYWDWLVVIDYHN